MYEVIELNLAFTGSGPKTPTCAPSTIFFPPIAGTLTTSFLIKGKDKIAIIDTVKRNRSEEFLAKVKQLVIRRT